MEKVKKILLFFIVIALIIAIGFVTVSFVLSKTEKKSNPIVTMEIEGYGTVKIELYPDMAPNTVKNFIKLAQKGYYDGKTISDIADGLIEGGFDLSTESDDSSTEEVGPKLSNIKNLAEGEEDKSYAIKGEFIENGDNDNTLSHKRGVISMARKSYTQYQQEIAMVQMMGYTDYVNTLVQKMYDSQGSGFFILTEDKTEFDGTYAAFGEVREGMDVVDAISKIELKTTTSDDGTETKTNEPVNAPVITKVTVDTFGVDYGDPEVIDMFDFDAVFNMFMKNYMQSSSTTTSTAE